MNYRNLGTLTHQKIAFKHNEEAKAAEAKKSGKVLSGYKTVELQQRGKSGQTHRRNVQEAIYIDAPKTQTKTVYKDRPVAAKPKPKAKPKEPIQHSPEIEQAKERVKSYENGKSPWEEAQANVQSSFIKDTGSSSNNQYDFSGNTFDVNQSSKPNEQAQAAQNQMQNYISKYSSFKSNSN